MNRWKGSKTFRIVLLSFILAETASASPDPRLISLVPPNASLVSGISASPGQGRPSNFSLMTHYNWVDFQDFFALTGAVDDVAIHQLVVAEVATSGQQPKEHVLLASGHFDQQRVFKSALEGGASAMKYRGTPVLEIKPFTRERGVINDDRWLTILDSSFVIFGSIASAQLAIDRYLAHSPADEYLVQRLTRLRNKNQSWCLLSAPGRTLPSLNRGHEIFDALAELSPELASLARVANELEFGLFYGRRVEFEFEVNLSSKAGGRVDTDLSSRFPVGSLRSTSLLPTLNTVGNANTFHGTIKISMSRYKSWLSHVEAERPQAFPAK